MAVPFRRVSKSRRNMRSAGKGLTVPNLVECKSCNKKIKTHHVCPYCGTYDGKKVK